MPLLWHTRSPTATRFCSAGRCRTSTKPWSSGSRSTIRQRLGPDCGHRRQFSCIAVHPTVPAQNLKELIAYAQANPGKLSYGHAGVGSIQHLTGELFKSLTGTSDIAPVAYRGTGPLITDLVGGHIQMGVPGVTGQVIELHRSGKMRVFAVQVPRGSSLRQSSRRQLSWASPA